MPENENYIENFLHAIHDSIIYRLGNYTIIEDDKNRKCETLPFNEKKIIFHTSQYGISKQIQSNEWTPNTIDKRLEMLANYASFILRISQYDWF